MNILEQEIEELVWNAINEYDFTLLQERGLPISEKFKYFRQLTLANYGRADLVGFNVHPSHGRGPGLGKVRVVEVQIIELKKEKIGAGTFFQALRYAKGIQHMMKHECMHFDLSFDFHLIGKSIESSGEFAFLPSIFKTVNFYTYQLSITKGLIFKEANDLCLISPGFSKNSSDLKSIFYDQLIERLSDGREGASIQKWITEQELKKVGASDKEQDADNDWPF